MDFQTLVNPIRVKILNLLYDRPLTLKDLTENLDLSKPELSRHLAMMRDLSLVERIDSTNNLTSLGQSIVEILAPLDFIINNYEFFKHHSLNGIPSFLLRELDVLLDSERINGLGYVMRRIGESFNLSGDSQFVMIDQPFDRSSEPSSKVTNGFYIVPTYAKDENIKDSLLLQNHTAFEVRKLGIVPIAIGIHDSKTGVLFFADNLGKIDYNTMFYISEELGIAFLNKLWNYYWNSAQFYKKFPK